MRLTVRLARNAEKQLRRLPKDERSRLGAALSRLGEPGRPEHAAKIKGRPGLFRVRVGNYRIVYRIDHAAGTIHVAEIANRREAYRKLNRLET